MRIRIIGCGAMGSAIAIALAKNNHNLSIFDHHYERATMLAKEFPQMQACTSPLEMQTPTEYLLLAMKSGDFGKAASELAGYQGKLIISILPGISLKELKAAFPKHLVMRMMPNLAVQYSKGMVALVDDPTLDSIKEDIDAALSSLGSISWIPEEKFNAFTALTSCGPAFIFAMIEAMVDASISMGFSSREGLKLIIDMMGGSLCTLVESKALPSELKWRVTSPGGPTIAGLRTLEAQNIRSGMIETFLSAYEKMNVCKSITTS